MTNKLLIYQKILYGGGKGDESFASFIVGSEGYLFLPSLESLIKTMRSSEESVRIIGYSRLDFYWLLTMLAILRNSDDYSAIVPHAMQYANKLRILH